MCKRPEPGHPRSYSAPPPPPRPPPLPPSAALAAAEPVLMENVLAPSEQDQCLGRKCGQSPTCTLHPPSTILLSPWDLGRPGTLGLACGRSTPTASLCCPLPSARPEWGQNPQGQEQRPQSLPAHPGKPRAQVSQKQPSRGDLKSPCPRQHFSLHSHRRPCVPGGRLII